MRTARSRHCVSKLTQDLNEVQSAVFLETCEGRSCKDIAQHLNYDRDYIKQVSSQL